MLRHTDTNLNIRNDMYYKFELIMNDLNLFSINFVAAGDIGIVIALSLTESIS